VLGGYLADRYLGQRKAVLYGGVLLALGHLAMAVEGDGGQGDRRSTSSGLRWR
jgi:POT family proton-dependent oligopeptide transporter